MEIVRLLEQSAAEFRESAAKASLDTTAQPGRWSVLEIVEHVTVVEDRFRTRLENATPGDAQPANPAREAELTGKLADRTGRLTAPEPVQPTGRFANLAEALGAFEASRARTIQLAHQRGPELYCLAIDHPRFGRVNGFEALLIVAGHARRHAEQIREI